MIWNEKAIAFLKKALNNGLTYPEIARQLNVSPDAVQKAIQRAGLKRPEKSIDDIVLDFENLKSSSADKRKIKELTENVARLTRERDAWMKFQEHQVHQIIRPVTSGKISATALINTADWHCEEEVKPESVNGLNRYNLDIAESRLSYMWSNSIRLLEMSARDVKLDGVIVNVLGDLISGNIHPENLETGLLEPVEASLWALDHLHSGLSTIAEWCHRKRIPLTVVGKVGNHSRITEKRHISTEEGNALEWMIYHTCKRMLPEINWVLDKGYLTYLKVYDRTIRIHHGTVIKNGGGVGGVMIPLAKAVDGWDKGIKADLNIQGHLHQQLNAFNTMLIGSLIGYNAFALSIRAKFEHAMQKYALYTNRGVLTGEHVIFLEPQ